MYYVATQEFSNGFPYTPKVEAFESLDLAFKEFNKLAFEAQQEYPDSTPRVINDFPSVLTSFIDGENHQGNGTLVLLGEDYSLTCAIQARTTISKQRHELVTLGDKKTIREDVHAIYLPADCLCKMKNDEYRCADYIIERDENPENKTGNNLYEVFFDNGFCENIEEVTPEALVTIFLATC